MELPIARIRSAIAHHSQNGAISFKDSVYKQVLIGLEPERIESGDIVAVLKISTPEVKARPYCFQLFKLTSEYEFETTNSTHLINQLRDRLEGMGFELITIAIAYHTSSGWMVGTRPIEMQNQFGQFYSRARALN